MLLANILKANHNAAFIMCPSYIHQSSQEDLATSTTSTTTTTTTRPLCYKNTNWRHHEVENQGSCSTPGTEQGCQHASIVIIIIIIILVFVLLRRLTFHVVVNDNFNFNFNVNVNVNVNQVLHMLCYWRRPVPYFIAPDDHHGLGSSYGTYIGSTLQSIFSQN